MVWVTFCGREKETVSCKTYQQKPGSLQTTLKAPVSAARHQEDSCDEPLVCSDSEASQSTTSGHVHCRKKTCLSPAFLNLMTAQHMSNKIWRLVISSSRKHDCSYHQWDLEKAGSMMRTEGIRERVVRVFHYTCVLQRHTDLGEKTNQPTDQPTNQKLLGTFLLTLMIKFLFLQVL